MTTRRKFIKNSLLVGAAGIIPGRSLGNWIIAEQTVLPSVNHPLTHNSPKHKISLLVLHTNDFHSRLEPFPSNHSQAGKGGIRNLGSLIRQKKTEADNVLLLDCGDVFQGTPYFNFFGGKIEFEWMSMLNYHASTMGNHDFDNGIDHLARMLEQHAKFPMVNCNYDLSNTPLNNLVKPYRIVEIAGKKIGITGIGINPDNLIVERLIPGLVYSDPILPLQNTVNHLRKIEYCDAVFVLSHLGYQYNSDKIDDIKLAERTHGIDAIMGGHTHTFLEQPSLVKNIKGGIVLVNQAHWAGLMLGQMQFNV